MDIFPQRDTEEIAKYFCKNFYYQQCCKVNLVVEEIKKDLQKEIDSLYNKKELDTGGKMAMEKAMEIVQSKMK